MLFGFSNSPGLKDAAETYSRVVTPFFQEITYSITAGILPALLTRPQHAIDTLWPAMAKINTILMEAGAWQGSGTSGVGSRASMNVQREQGAMLDACFAAATAALDGKHNPSPTTINPQYMCILATAFRLLQNLRPHDASGQLLGNPQRLASLEYLISKVVPLCRKLPSLGRWHEDGLLMLSEAVDFINMFLETMCQLPNSNIPSTLASLPPVLLPSCFLLLDEQLPSATAHIYNIIMHVKHLVSVLMTLKLPTTDFISPELASLAQHLLVTCVPGMLPGRAGPCVSPGQVVALQNCVLRMLLLARELPGSLIPVIRARQGSKRSSASSSSSSSNEPPQRPTVSHNQYFHALCLCSSTCNIPGADGNCLYANSLIETIVNGWHGPGGGGPLLVGWPQAANLLSLLRFLSRQAQQRIQPAVRLQERRQQQARQNPAVLHGDSEVLRNVILDTSYVLMELIGAYGAGEHAQILYPIPKSVSAGALAWTALPGSAAVVEALLRDPHMRGSCTGQAASADIALMILSTPHNQHHATLLTRISLAATLRKLMHPASTPMWAAAIPNPDPNIQTPVWRPAAACSSSDMQHCLDVIAALSARHLNAIEELDSRKSVREKDVSWRSSGAPAGVRVTSLARLQLGTIVVATHVQLCRSTGSERLGLTAYPGDLDGLSDVATILLKALPGENLTGQAASRQEASLVASSWEQYAITHIPGRLLPGCSHWGCTNLEGSSEATLPTLLCSGCRRVRYCCKGCQKAAWVGGHRDLCESRRQPQ